ncbi:MAG TPA: 4a-hydroxytetrahydrobiopterin dehydratase [Acidimicrobiales bacterium]|nr:4a-hydroxytetrahydrobiopterin dehydratase [Acidimicrobiales bacterium]
MATLSDDEIRTALAGLPGWEHVESAISRQYRLDGFAGAIAFVVRLSYAAEAANHHPDVDIRYDKVRITLSTHSEGGVTAKDVDLATAIERFAPAQ